MTTLRNSVTLTGNLGSNPEIISYGEGKKLAKFSLAVNSTFSKESPSKPAWFNLVAFDNIAAYIEKYINKGERIMVTGKLKAKTWLSKDGKTHYGTEVVVAEVVRVNTPAKV
ncbi:MAG: single-stranded DNA-binding protein [Saprospiraceae bacterium]|nr:single-stranded DNA-binding protein [Saprospiraceae bacterium]MBK7811180.1 single-stranded DNA-binding protein [Saprospiraceae bacterium]MBK9631115.1 single-stranded DNA-binding protein [Saprospiraceae bacterium]